MGPLNLVTQGGRTRSTQSRLPKKHFSKDAAVLLQLVIGRKIAIGRMCIIVAVIEPTEIKVKTLVATIGKKKKEIPIRIIPLSKVPSARPANRSFSWRFERNGVKRIWYCGGKTKL